MSSSDVQEYISRLTDIAKKLNAFAESLKSQRASVKTIRELGAEYKVDLPDDFPEMLFDDSDLEWLQS
jgi:hypothetical protein